jgi:hypothetical protein
VNKTGANVDKEKALYNNKGYTLCPLFGVGTVANFLCLSLDGPSTFLFPLFQEEHGEGEESGYEDEEMMRV